MDSHKFRDHVSTEALLKKEKIENKTFSHKFYVHSKLSDMIEKDKDIEINKKLFNYNLNINEAYLNIMSSNLTDSSHQNMNTTKENTKKAKMRYINKIGNKDFSFQKIDLMELGIFPKTKAKKLILKAKKEITNSKNDLLKLKNDKDAENSDKYKNLDPSNNSNIFLFKNNFDYYSKNYSMVQNNDLGNKLYSRSSFNNENSTLEVRGFKYGCIDNLNKFRNLSSYKKDSKNNILSINHNESSLFEIRDKPMNLLKQPFNESSNFYSSNCLLNEKSNYQKFLTGIVSSQDLKHEDKPNPTKNSCLEKSLNNSLKDKNSLKYDKPKIRNMITIKRNKSAYSDTFRKDNRLIKIYQTLKDNFFIPEKHIQTDSSMEDYTQPKIKNYFNKLKIEKRFTDRELNLVKDNKKKSKAKININIDEKNFRNTVNFNTTKENHRSQKLKKEQIGYKITTLSNINRSKPSFGKQTNLQKGNLISLNFAKIDKNYFNKINKCSPLVACTEQKSQFNFSSNEFDFKDTNIAENKKIKQKVKCMNSNDKFDIKNNYKESLSRKHPKAFLARCKERKDSIIELMNIDKDQILKDQKINNNKTFSNGFSSNSNIITNEKNSIFNVYKKILTKYIGKQKKINSDHVEYKEKQNIKIYDNNNKNKKFKFQPSVKIAENCKHQRYQSMKDSVSFEHKPSSNILIESATKIENSTHLISKSFNRKIKRYKTFKEIDVKKDDPPEQKYLTLKKKSKNERKKNLIILSSIDESKTNFDNLSENRKSLLKIADLIKSMNDNVVLKLKDQIQSQYRKSAVKNGLININEKIEEKYSNILKNQNNLQYMTIKAKKLENSILKTRNEIEKQHFTTEEREKIKKKSKSKKEF